MLLLDGLSLDEVRTRGRAKGSCRRVLNQIYRRGDGLAEVRLSNDRGSVHLAVWAAEVCPACEPARDDFFNPLWDLLAAGRPPSAKEVASALFGGMDHLGIAQLTSEGIGLGLQLCGTSFPVRPGDDEQVRHGAQVAAIEGSLYSILVLALQCRMAGERAQYAHAQVYLDALEACTEALGRAVDEPYLARLLMDQIDLRLLQNVWDPSRPKHWLHAYVHEKGNTDLDHDKWRTRARMYGRNGNRTRSAIRKENATIPMLKLDSNLAWFLGHGNQLLSALMAEKAGGRQDLVTGKIPDRWQELLEKARYLFGEPRDTKTYFSISISGAPESDELEIVPLTKRKALQRDKRPPG
ncbi:MAG: hypothetical protein K0U79_00910 [Gammaproteobacteria bacterium]|nr:hypothetical protein [Gammaproteobacteria bacterium]